MYCFMFRHSPLISPPYFETVSIYPISVAVIVAVSLNS